MRKAFTLLFSLIAYFAVAQVGTIKGMIKDEVTGEPIIGANVVIEGTTIGTSTDLEGSFAIPKVKAGTYSVVITFVSYTSKTIPNVEVYPDQTTVINTSIKEDSQVLESIVVSAGRLTNTDVAVMTELKSADLVAVGISSQQIRMSQDRDAAQVIRRVPGVTIVGGRFVNVRGLSERYSTVTLNGIIAPSSEVDSKAFAFDLIPSNMLDRMLVYKSGSPELPGEFAGADVSIFTKSIVEENFTSLSIQGSFRSGTTGQSAMLSKDNGSSDWVGGNDGSRDLPAGFPSNIRALQAGDANLNTATRNVGNPWLSRSVTASPDLRVNFDFARSIPIGSKKLDNISSISYASTNQYIDGAINNFYDATNPRFKYIDTRYTQTRRLGVVSNFTFHFNPSHRIEFRNFYNQQGLDQSTFRTGTENAIGYDVRNQSFNYLSRGIYSGQLSGRHAMSDAVNFNWIFGFNNTNADQPNYRRGRSQRSTGGTDDFSIVIPSSASAQDGRFDSKLNEKSYSAAGNVEIKLNPSADEDKQAKFITGYYLEQKDRTFNARWVSNSWANVNSIDLALTRRPFDQIFTSETLGTSFLLSEGTNVGPDNYDRYDGHNRLIAGYAGIVTPFATKFRLSAGLRIEDNTQQLDVYSETGIRIRKVDNNIVVPMPFANLSFSLTEKMLLRVAYSKTVNRPVFRELAPFNYYDFDRNADIFGNPDLTTARIDNIDLSWEFYPTKPEKISVGVFYKKFQDPIEQYLAPGSNLRYGYVNADGATTYGVEAEVRKSLQNSASQFLQRLTLVLNGALIKSEIVLPASKLNLERSRAMQGQSPFVANAGVYYAGLNNGWEASIQYNVIGDRIFAVGDLDNPNQYELSRNQIDITVSKKLSEHFELRFGIQDLLNQPYRIYQDSNRDGKINTDKDDVIQSYKWGQYTTLGVIWKF